MGTNHSANTRIGRVGTVEITRCLREKCHTPMSKDRASLSALAGSIGGPSRRTAFLLANNFCLLSTKANPVERSRQIDLNHFIRSSESGILFTCFVQNTERERFKNVKPFIINLPTPTPSNSFDETHCPTIEQPTGCPLSSRVQVEQPQSWTQVVDAG